MLYYTFKIQNNSFQDHKSFRTIEDARSFFALMRDGEVYEGANIGRVWIRLTMNQEGYPDRELWSGTMVV